MVREPTDNRVGSVDRMGRQVGIYFTLEDSQNFLDFATTTRSVVVLPWQSPTSNFVPISRPDDKPRAIFLFNRDVSSNLVTRYVSQQGYYVLDTSQSFVIEFSRSIIRENTMFPGRIWAEFTFLNKGRTALLPKEPEFSKWYDTIATWIRKHSERVLWTDQILRKTSVIGYAGPGAQTFHDSGGRLAINPPSPKRLDDKLPGRIIYRGSLDYEPIFKTLVEEDLLVPKNEFS
jgi:hypothetical protein